MKDTKLTQLCALQDLLREFVADQHLSLEVRVRHQGVKVPIELKPSTARALLRIGIGELRRQLGAKASDATFKNFIGRALSK